MPTLASRSLTTRRRYVPIDLARRRPRRCRRSTTLPSTPMCRRSTGRATRDAAPPLAIGRCRRRWPFRRRPAGSTRCDVAVRRRGSGSTTWRPAIGRDGRSAAPSIADAFTALLAAGAGRTRRAAGAPDDRRRRSRSSPTRWSTRWPGACSSGSRPDAARDVVVEVVVGRGRAARARGNRRIRSRQQAVAVAGRLEPARCDCRLQ